jgi:fumarate reductase (CoM/CoB) subunit A
VAIDLSGIPKEEFQRIRQFTGVRRYTEQILVAPTAHFFMGGVEINENCETEFDGLYAAGEVCGGTHGANRIEGNAITETLVFGTIAGDRAATRASKVKQIPASDNQVTAEVDRLRDLVSHQVGENLNELQQSLKYTMWHKVGVIRNGKSLADAQREILALRDQLRAVSPADYRQLSQVIKLDNMLTVSEMVCKAALARTESRGAHYRTDYPEHNDAQWLKTIDVYCHGGEMTLRTATIKEE